MGYLCGTLYAEIGLYSDDGRPVVLQDNSVVGPTLHSYLTEATEQRPGWQTETLVKIKKSLVGRSE